MRHALKVAIENMFNAAFALNSSASFSTTYTHQINDCEADLRRSYTYTILHS